MVQLDMAQLPLVPLGMAQQAMAQQATDPWVAMVQVTVDMVALAMA